MLIVPFYQVDAFASKPFTGNPAAVCLLPVGAELADSVLRDVAAEINLAETAFVQPLGADQSNDPFTSRSRFKLRWFTPTTEVPLCGHATLASAAVLFTECGNISDRLEFETLSGCLAVSRATKEIGSQDIRCSMVLPCSDPTDPVPPECTAPRFIEAIVGSALVSEVRYSSTNGLNYLLVELAVSNAAKGGGRQLVEALQPDPKLLLTLGRGSSIQGLIVTAQDTSGDFDFVSRFFGPWMGIDEDHVTGSAHAVLGPHWAAKLKKNHLRARQCSARGGELELCVGGRHEGVVVTGSAVVLISGRMRIQ